MRPLIHKAAALIATALLCAAAGCGPGTEAPSEGGEAAFRVALLNPGPISDAGWNAIAYQGLLRIEEELGAEIRQKESKGGVLKQDLLDFARDGFDLVIGHGFEYSVPISEIASDFPATVFVSSGGEKVGENYSYQDFMLEEATYFLGIIAGTMTQSGVVGMIAGLEIPPVRRSNASFVQGLRLANPEAKVRSAIIGNWEDAGKAKELALAQIKEGADIIYQNADKAGLGVFQAAKDNPGTYAFGANGNQNDLSPEIILASAVMDVPEGFVQLAQRVRDGTFESEPIHWGLKQGVITLEINEKLRDRIPARAFELIEVEREKILSGALDVNALGEGAP